MNVLEKKLKSRSFLVSEFASLRVFFNIEELTLLRITINVALI